MRLTWLAGQLHASGLKVVEVAGWQGRGVDYDRTPSVFLFHHTAESSRSGNAGGLAIVTHGRTGLPGPIANLYLGRDGTVYVVAAGVSNNAGHGNARAAGLPSTSGNSSTIAMEMANNGTGEPYAPAMYRAALLVAAVIARRMSWPAGRFIGHKEWSTSGKVDPLWDMPAARRDLAAVIANPTTAAAPKGPFMALSDQQQADLYADVQQIRAVLEGEIGSETGPTPRKAWGETWGLTRRLVDRPTPLPPPIDAVALARQLAAELAKLPGPDEAAIERVVRRVFADAGTA